MDGCQSSPGSARCLPWWVGVGARLAALGVAAVLAVVAASWQSPAAALGRDDERRVPVTAAAVGAVQPAQQGTIDPTHQATVGPAQQGGGRAATPSGVPTPAIQADQLPDPYRPQQWHLDRLGLSPDRRVPDGRGQVIAVLDSGVDLDHPDLADVLTRTDGGRVLGRDLVDDDDRPQDEFGHGTMVAGIAAARAGNGLGIAGTVSGGVRLLPVRVLDEAGRGTSSTVAAGIDWAIARGATVVNLSLESAGMRGVTDDPELARAVRDAVDAGAVVVVAAGNQPASAPDPASGGGVVVVGATDRDDRRAGFSDRGRRDLLMAPGVEIVSTWCRVPERPTCDGQTHTYGVADGTSFAAPQVSGLVAMLASTGLTPHEAADRLAATAIDLGEPGADPRTGRGLVSADTGLGAWPDVPVPATTPSPLARSLDPSTAPAEASPQAVTEAEPPDDSDATATRLLAGLAVLAAIGLLVHGLTGGRHERPH